MKARKQAKGPLSCLMSSTSSACLEPAADTSAAPEVIPYESAVLEGKEIVLEIEAVTARGHLRLGELAHKVEIKYGDRTLAKFAEDISVATCTLARHRDVYRAYPNICAPGRKCFPSYAALRELAAHPDREEIVAKDPNITKREAHRLMRQQAYTAKTKREQEQEDNWGKHNRGWFKALVTLGDEVMRTAGAVNVDECTPEQQESLRQVIDANLLRRVRASGRVLIKTADHLASLCGLDENYDPIPATAEASPIQQKMAAE
jgi:hypothetical protein